MTMRKMICNTIKLGANCNFLGRSSIFSSVLLLCSFGSGKHAVAQLTSDLMEREPSIRASQHTVKVEGADFPYTATAGFLPIQDEQERIHAQMFFVYYAAGHKKASGPRPLVFVWNGGPGSNASLLELGALGPKRILSAAEAGKNDRTLVDNEETWLRFADLVFVDPVFTGYSYATTDEYQRTFLSDKGDADAMAEFIRIFRVHFQTQSAPVFLLGESYGTYRAVGVADLLLRRGIPVSGLMLLSTILKFAPDADIGSALILPNYTAAAFAQHKLDASYMKDLSTTVSESQRWAETTYISDLIQGDKLSIEEKEDASRTLEKLTGVDASIWLKANLRLTADDFAIDLLGPSRDRYVGHYDTRVVGTFDRAGASYDVSKDPSLDSGVESQIVPYLRNELGWKSDAFYAGPFGGRWPSPDSPRADWTSSRWDRSGNSIDRGPMLASAMLRAPRLRLLVASGYFDLSTPFAAADYTISHLALPTEARKRIRLVRYEGGHAAYLTAVVRHQFSHDAEAFVTASPNPSP